MAPELSRTDPGALSADTVVGLLAEAARLQVFAAAALGARTVSELAQRSGHSHKVAARARHALVESGLLAEDGSVDVAALQVLARLAAPQPPRLEPAARALAAFLREGRVTSFPAQAGRRRAVLEHLVQAVPKGEQLTEKELHMILDSAADGPDLATLRRYLVDEGLLARADGRYWRP